MGVDMVVVCIFEFVGYFVVHYFIRLVGHSGIMYIGLLGYAIRFVVYASIRNPWTVLPVETLQGSLLYVSVLQRCCSKVCMLIMSITCVNIM